MIGIILVFMCLSHSSGVFTFSICVSIVLRHENGLLITRFYSQDLDGFYWMLCLLPYCA